MSKLKNKLVYLLIVLIPLLLVLMWFKDGNIMGSGESGLPFYDLQREAEAVKYAWADNALGNPTSITITGYYFYSFFALFQKLGVPNFVIQALFFWLCFVFAGIGIYWLNKLLFPKIKDKYAFIAVLFYWFNPISMVNVWNRFLYNFMVYWAFLPLVIFLFYKGLVKKDIRFALLTSLSTLLFSYSLTSPAFLLIMWLIFAVITLFQLYLAFNKNSFLFSLKYLFITLITFVLVNYWWIGQLFIFSTSTGYQSAVGSFFSPTGNIDTLNQISGALGNLEYIFKFLHQGFYESFPLVRIYNIFPFNLLLLMPVFVILVGISKHRENKYVILLGLLFLISVFLMKGSNPPFSELFTIPFSFLSILQTFRNPFEKFSFILIVSSAILFAYSLSSVSSTKFKKVLFSSIVVLFVMYIYPYVTSFVFSSSAGYLESEINDYKVTVPHFYRDVSNYLAVNGNDSRTIVLPFGGEGMTYTWNESFSGVELTNTLIESPVISFNTTIPFYYDYVSSLSNYQLYPEKLASYMPLINGKYLLVKDDVDYRLRDVANPENIRASLDSDQAMFREVYKTDSAHIYEINEDYYWPKVYVANNVIASNANDISEVVELDGNFPSSKLAIIPLTVDKIITSKTFIAPVSSFSINEKDKDFSKLSEEEILANLLFVKHMPTDPLYPFIRLKETIFTPSSSDNFYKDSLVNNLGKRAVEIYKLKSSGTDGQLIEKIENDYRNSWNEVKMLKLNDYLINILLYQEELFKRVDSELATLINDYLVSGNKRKLYQVNTGDELVVYRFNIAKPGTYLLSLSEQKGEPVFLDGKLLNSSTLSLNTGIHEIAVPKKDITNLLYEVEQLEVKEPRRLISQIALSKVPTKYNISFEYRFREGTQFTVEFLQDNDHPTKAYFSYGVKKDNAYHGWSKFDYTFTSGVGGVGAEVFIKALESKECRPQSIIYLNCITYTDRLDLEVRNVRISEISSPEPKLVSESGVANRQTDTVTSFRKVNPSLYEVTVEKQNATPEVIVFSELYNSQWQAIYEDDVQIPEDMHFLVNSYANGWIIDRAGNHRLTIKFVPQEILETGKAISTASIMGSLATIGMITHKKRRA